MACDTTTAAAAGTVSVLGTSAPFDASVAAATSNSAVAGFGGPAVPFKRRRLPLRQARPSLGQRAADAVARFGGSWTFVALFATALFAWVALNAYLLAGRGKTFDPYPYVLLNLFLSMLAAIQAPVILMSQNLPGETARAGLDKPGTAALFALVNASTTGPFRPHAREEAFLVSMDPTEMEKR